MFSGVKPTPSGDLRFIRVTPFVGFSRATLGGGREPEAPPLSLGEAGGGAELSFTVEAAAIVEALRGETPAAREVTESDAPLPSQAGASDDSELFCAFGASAVLEPLRSKVPAAGVATDSLEGEVRSDREAPLPSREGAGGAELFFAVVALELEPPNCERLPSGTVTDEFLSLRLLLTSTTASLRFRRASATRALSWSTRSEHNTRRISRRCAWMSRPAAKANFGNYSAGTTGGIYYSDLVLGLREL